MADHAHAPGKPKSRAGAAIRFLFENSLFLVLGAVAALVWANLDRPSYELFIHGELGADGARHGPGHLFHFVVNEIGMAFFFALAAKEIWEAMLPGGALSSIRTAGTPLIATFGGMLGPAGLYVLGCVLLDRPDLTNGWAIPTATDIAFSYLVARIIFGAGHPAIPFLLLLAIADDAGGLIILAVFYPTGAVSLGAFAGLVGAAIALALVMHHRLRLHSFWWYMLPGAISWLGFLKGGIHPALGLVPIIPCMPHAKTDLGLFAVDEETRTDTLNEFEHWFKHPVQIALGFFGLANAGVTFSSVGAGTALVGLGLIIGKPLGIFFCTKVIAQGIFRLSLPKGMESRDVIALGVTAGIGFTVALFVSTVAFEDPAQLDPAKMGALLSFGSAGVAWGTARLLGVKRWVEPENGESDGANGGDAAASGAASAAPAPTPAPAAARAEDGAEPVAASTGSAEAS